MDDRPAPLDAAIAPAPAAFLTFWGLLIHVFGTQPVRPYTDGAWAPGDLLFLGVLGLVIGLVCRPLSATAGIVLGMAAVVALQLFVLAGQAHYQAVVVAALSEPAWTRATGGALALAIVVLVVGSLVTRALIIVGRLVSRPTGPSVRSAADSTAGSPPGSARSRTGRPDARAMVGLAGAGLAVLVIAGLMVGVSLVTTAQSAYLPAADEPVVRVQFLDDGTLTLAPEAVPAGRVTIIADGVPTPDGLHLYGPMSPEDEAWLRDGRVNSRGRDVYWSHNLRRAALDEPGRYAFVAPERDWTYPQGEAEWAAWDGSMPISAARLLQVSAAKSRAGLTTEAGGDGGAHLTLPTAAALGIEGWAAAGALFLAIRRYRRPTEAHVVVAVLAGLASAVFAGMLIGLAISQAHSPF